MIKVSKLIYDLDEPPSDNITMVGSNKKRDDLAEYKDIPKPQDITKLPDVEINLSDILDQYPHRY